MELRYWLAEALTGDIGPEVRLQGQPRFTQRFGGGDFTADIMLGHLRGLDGELDRAAAEEILSWSDGGKFSIVVTHGYEWVGEWLIWRSEPVDGDGPVRVSGFELDGYPSFRSINADYRYREADQLGIASKLLRDAFSSHQDFQINVPSPSSGVSREMDHKAHTAYYSDLLEEISAPDDGFQWRVESSVWWDRERARGVTRLVRFGHPELRRDGSVSLSRGREGTRQGNLAAFPRPARDFSKYAQSVYGWGRGEGAKQQWFGVSDPTLTNQGHLIVTKNITFSGTTSDAALRSATRAALAQAQDLREPVTATVLADRVPSIPRVGEVLPVKVGESAAWPYGFEGHVQVGQVEMRPSGSHLETFDLLAV